ncbi:MAG: T9SS C-terminal target domain-containing protein [Chlorobi bacterium]|nr:T9SS C-terminal target domain-containing protein [Chlorobiota bacterium]
MELRKLNMVLFALLLSAVPASLFGQNNPMSFKRWNEMNINKVATTFNNVGMLNNGNNQNASLARIPSFEYPQGSGLNWGTCVAVVVGAPFGQDPAVVGGVNPEEYPYLDGTMDEGPADFWNEEHFAPYPEFTNENLASVSNDPNSWPASWPDKLPNYIFKDGVSDEIIENNGLPVENIYFDSETGWPGFGKNGKQIADQETFSVMYGWGGTDQLGSGNSKTRWLRTQLIMRGLAWEGTLYENFIVWVFILRNPNDKPITDLRMGVHSDFGFLPAFLPGVNFDDDRHYFDSKLQLAYGWDDDGYEENPLGGGVLNPEDIAWAGVVALQMPGGDGKIKTYDATNFWMGQTTASGSGGDPEMYYKWNLLNEDDPEDSDGDGIDDDFDHNGVPDDQDGGPGYYIGIGADGLQIIGSNPFTLQPGESDTLIFATVFGKSEKDIKSNALRAITLYENNWEVVKAPPAPEVEAFADDQKVTLVWGTKSEEDEQFEGYKIYRSQDNGKTWGDESFTDFDGGIHYVPLRQYDLENGVKGYYQTLPEYAWYYLGDDSWVPTRFVVEADTIKGFNLGYKLTHFNDGDSVNVFVDRSVSNGIEYQYYVAAYDSGNGIIGPLENSAASNPDEFNNSVKVRPELPTAKTGLGKVRVVPNPYKIAEVWENSWDSHVIQFTGLPEKATIMIFNSSGETVKTLYHDSMSSIEAWDLKNEYNQQVSAGVYFYYITSSLGETKGKFFVIL